MQREARKYLSDIQQGTIPYGIRRIRGYLHALQFSERKTQASPYISVISRLTRAAALSESRSTFSLRRCLLIVRI